MNALAETGAALLGGTLRRTEALSGGSLSQIVRIELTDGREAIVSAGPSEHVRSTWAAIRERGALPPRAWVVSATKGIENGTLKRMSEIVEDVLGSQRLVVMSGPTIAIEVARHSPTTIVAASKDLGLSLMLRSVIL